MGRTSNLEASSYLSECQSMNFSSPPIQAFIQEFKSSAIDPEMLQRLYLKVRDGFLYDPYHLDLRKSALIASEILKKKRAWCVEKALVLAACARGLGIPSQLNFSIVVNHLGVDKLEHYLGRKEIVFHGSVSLFVFGKWSRCTPAFDRRICRISGVPPLEWNGKEDSLFQQEIEAGAFMEYLHDYGDFADIPFELMHSEMKYHYPQLFQKSYDSKDFSFRYD